MSLGRAGAPVGTASPVVPSPAPPTVGVVGSLTGNGLGAGSRGRATLTTGHGAATTAARAATGYSTEPAASTGTTQRGSTARG